MFCWDQLGNEAWDGRFWLVVRSIWCWRATLFSPDLASVVSASKIRFLPLFCMSCRFD